MKVCWTISFAFKVARSVTNEQRTVAVSQVQPSDGSVKFHWSAKYRRASCPAQLTGPRGARHSWWIYNAPYSWKCSKERPTFRGNNIFASLKMLKFKAEEKIGGQIIIEMSTCGCWRIRLLLLYRAGMVARNGGVGPGKLLLIFDMVHLTVDDDVDRFRLIIQIQLCSWNDPGLKTLPLTPIGSIIPVG